MVKKKARKQMNGLLSATSEIKEKEFEARKKPDFVEDDDDDEMEFDEESNSDDESEDDVVDAKGLSKNVRSPGGKAFFTIDKTPSKQTPGKTPQAKTPGKDQNKSLLSAKAAQQKQQEDEEEEDDEEVSGDEEEAMLTIHKNVKSSTALGNGTPGKQQTQLKNTPGKQTSQTRTSVKSQKQKNFAPAGIFKLSVEDDEDEDDSEVSENEDDDDEVSESEEDEDDSEEDEVAKGGKNALVNSQIPSAQGAQKQTSGKRADQKQQSKSASFEEKSNDEEDDEDEDTEDEEEEDETSEKGNQTSQPIEEKWKRQLYIGNLPSDATEADIKGLSSDIVFVDLPKKRGKVLFAFAWFPSEEKTDQNYRKLQGTVLKGCAVRILYCGEKGSKGLKSNSSSVDNDKDTSAKPSGGEKVDGKFDKSILFLKDIPEGVTMLDLGRNFPNAKGADIFFGKDGKHRFAKVMFSSLDDAAKYIENSRTVSLHGKDINLAYGYGNQSRKNNFNRGKKRPYGGKDFGGNYFKK